MFTSSISLSVASFLIFKSTYAQNSTSNNSSLPNCTDIDGIWNHGYNATGSVTVPGFRVNDSYPDAGSWTWSRYVVNDVDTANSSEVWETIGLKTNPLLNLSDPSLPYTGCVIVPTGVKTSGSKAQQDDGTCSSIFSSACLSEITTHITNGAQALSGTKVDSSSCSNLLEIVSGSSATSKSSCQNVWDGTFSGYFLPTNFTGDTHDVCLPVNPGDSDSAHGAFFSWSDGFAAANAATNFTAYDAAILYPQPIFIASWLKSTSNTAPLNSNEQWADVRIMCIPANETTAGSRNVTEALKSGAGRIGGMGVSTGVSVFAGGVALFALLF